MNCRVHSTGRAKTHWPVDVEPSNGGQAAVKQERENVFFSLHTHSSSSVVLKLHWAVFLVLCCH